MEDLLDLLRIRSVAGEPAAMRRAVDWVCDFVADHGGTVERRTVDGVPLGVATLPASPGAVDPPTVLVYGHVDVQPAGPLEAWDSDPFEPVQRDGWLIARGVADDKGQLYVLLRAAAELAGEGRLPVNVRVLCDSEEESGGRTAVDVLRADPTPVSACVIFDSAMLGPGRPAVILGTRGIASAHVAVRTAEQDRHSGLHGGIAPNAAHALLRMIAAVLPGPDGLPAPLRAGVRPPAVSELEAWGAGRDARERVWAQPAVDVHGLHAGTTVDEINVVPARAEAMLSVRVAPGQDVDAIGEALSDLLRRAAPPAAAVTITPRSRTAPAGPMDPTSPAIALGLDALERGFGARPALVRSGGSMPILAALTARGIPTLLSGIDLPEGNVHGPNERLRLAHIPLGVSAGRALLRAWGALPPPAPSTDRRNAACATP